MEICRRCHDFSNDEDLKEKIYQYVGKISEEYRTNTKQYSRRLAACEACEMLRNAMCGHCGCFVLVRAAKKHNLCPKPYDNRWKFSKE